MSGNDEPSPEANPVTLDECDITDEEMRYLAPQGWKPMRRQLDFAREYIIKGKTESKAAIAERLAIPNSTMRHWYNGERFRTWMRLADIYFAGKVGVPLGWKAMADKASAGDRHCMHMLALRFDATYRAAVNKTPIEQHVPDPRIGGDSEAARRALLQTGVGTGKRAHTVRKVDLEPDEPEA